MEWLSRTELLVGKEKLSVLKNKNVLVVGLGGVGAYAAELICRAGVGSMTLVDGDKVDHSNRNRQLPALLSTQDMKKAEVVASRLKDINPEVRLEVIGRFIEDTEMAALCSGGFDYVVDAIDTISPKVNLIYNCVMSGVQIVSSMGAGGKFDTSLVKVVDVSKSYNCTLARKIRKSLNRLNIKKGFKVVFSPEEVAEEAVLHVQQQNKKTTVGTISFMPAIFGCHCAATVINHLLAEN